MASERKENKKRSKREKKEKKKRKRDSSVEPSTSLSSPVSEKKVKSLDEEINDENQIENPASKSAFQRKVASMLLSLAPSAMANPSKAMHTSMTSMLLKYSDGLGGVLLSFDNIKVDKTKNSGSYGKILNEMPHIHVYVKCNVLVFNPSVGTSLTGVVNETFPSHVGLLVHELFNAMISAESLQESGYEFDVDLNEWSKPDAIGPIAIDDSIKISVERLHECNGLISLECKDPIVIEEDKSE
jgi:hypothetical protein